MIWANITPFSTSLRSEVGKTKIHENVSLSWFSCRRSSFCQSTKAREAYWPNYWLSMVRISSIGAYSIFFIDVKDLWYWNFSKETTTQIEDLNPHFLHRKAEQSYMMAWFKKSFLPGITLKKRFSSYLVMHFWKNNNFEASSNDNLDIIGSID